MIIKLQRSRSSDAYIILEGVTNIEYNTKPILAAERRSIESSEGDGADIWYSDFNSTYLNIIRYTANDTHINLLFDGEAYVCTDEGKTIQKIPATCPTIRPL